MSEQIERIGWAVRVEEWESWLDAGTWEVPQPVIMGERIAKHVAVSWNGPPPTVVVLYAAPDGHIEALEAENRELRGVVKKYGDDPDYARSRFRQHPEMGDFAAGAIWGSSVGLYDRGDLATARQRWKDAESFDDFARWTIKLEHATSVRQALEAERDRYRDLADRLKLEAQIHAGEARCQTHTVHECYQAASGATGERGNWHGAQPVRERIASLEAERDELRATVERYHDLIYQVATKHPGETRHETARRYIQQAEMPQNHPSAMATP